MATPAITPRANAEGTLGTATKKWLAAFIMTLNATTLVDGVDSVTVAQIVAALTKLTGIEAAATADQTGAEIKTAYESEPNTNAYTDAEKTKLAAVAANADVTASANVEAAGAVMESDTTTALMQFVIDEDLMTSNLATKIPTQQSVKAYVDGVVASSVDFKGGYDAATNAPDLDTAPAGVQKGDMYVVTVAGDFFMANVEVGDVLIAEIDAATLESNWAIVNKNLTDASIKAAYENNTDTNAYTDAAQAKLGGIETAATADQTASEIQNAYESLVVIVSQAAAEAGTSTVAQRWTPQRVAQAIAKLGNRETTGKTVSYPGATAPSGWIILTGASAVRSLGNAASGAGYAAANALDLFSLYWGSMADTQAPVSSGRGANAAADFAANKIITIPDYRGRATIGVGTGSAGLTARVNGAFGGSEIHQLTTPETPAHYHNQNVNTALYQSSNAIQPWANSGTQTFAVGGATGSSGGNGSHNNMQPWLALNLIQKL